MKKIFLLSVCAVTCSTYAAEIIVDASQGKTIQSGLDKAKPGDTVLVKPGHYPETASFKTSGEPDKPITLKAEKPGTALVDGSDPVTGWKKVAKAEDVANTPNWKELYFAEVPDNKTYRNMSLYEDEKFSAFAQDPAPSDPFNFDNKAEFIQVDEETYTDTSITDPKYFTQKDKDYWVGASVILWSANNNMFYPVVKAYDPDTGTITYDVASRHIRPKQDRFAMVNHLDLIRKPGEFVVRKNPATGKNTLYYWPYDTKNLEAGKVRYSARGNGILIAQKSHLVIEGLDLRGHSDAAIKNGAGEFADTITVRNNHVYHAQHEGWSISLGYVNNALAENNYVHHIQGGRGIGVAGAKVANAAERVHAMNPIVRNNRISNCGSTGINFYGVKNGKMLNNTIHDNFGHHGNGLTAYLGCENILFEGNNVFRSNMALTMQEGDNFTIRDNILLGNGVDKGGIVVASYSNNLTNVTMENNIIMEGDVSFHLAHELSGYVIKKNVIHGLNIWTRQSEEGVVIAENLITRKLDWSGRDKGYAEKNTFETDLSKVFVDAAQGDFHRVKDGPLMEAGLLNGGRKVDLHPGPWEGRSAK